ncbi:MAG: hypothetical protein P4L20_11925, partial [Acidimicrobiales bacterium]|nr:hypothetical protein [Acidimicrobiales bacterium]
MAIGVSSRWARWVGLTGRRATSALAAPPGTAPQPPVPAVVDIGGRAGPGADPGAPLFEVCFEVVDVETTGGSPATAALTEIAAAKYQGGECVGVL